MEAEMDLWTAIGNECLTQAWKLMKKKTTLEPMEVKVVSELVDIAIKMDSINYRWERGTRLGSLALKNLCEEPTAKAN